MDFQKLLELVSDNQEAQSFIKGVQETQETNVQTINKNETLITNLKGDLEKFKQGNSLVKSKLGLEQLNEDSLSEALSKLNKNGGDEALKNEIANLQKLLEEAKTQSTQLENNYVDQIRELKTGATLKDIIAKAGVIEEAYDDAYSIAKSMMSFDENHNPIFKNADGTTKYLSNGKPMTMEDLPSVLKETKSYMFPRETKSGGGSKGSDGQGGGQQITMNATEMMKQGRK